MSNGRVNTEQIPVLSIYADFQRLPKAILNCLKGTLMEDYTCLSDEELVPLCRKKNEEAWNELCRRYFVPAGIIARSYIVFGAETDDLVQEGILGLVSAVETYRFDAGANFSTYATTCMKNKIKNFVRSSQSKSRTAERTAIALNGENELPDTALTPDELAVIKSEAMRVQNAVDSVLSEKERTVFNLYLKSATYEEIAEKLGISVKSVDGALQRTKKKIKKELEN